MDKIGGVYPKDITALIKILNKSLLVKGQPYKTNGKGKFKTNIEGHPGTCGNDP